LDRKEKLGFLTLYRKLPTQNQLLIKAVTNAQTQGNPTIDGIAKEIDKLTNTQTDGAWLKEKLMEAENAGLIGKVLVNREDQPSLAWRSRTLQNNQLCVISNFVKKIIK
jgi:hypothetical protein